MQTEGLRFRVALSGSAGPCQRRTVSGALTAVSSQVVTVPCCFALYQVSHDLSDNACRGLLKHSILSIFASERMADV